MKERNSTYKTHQFVDMTDKCTTLHVYRSLYSPMRSWNAFVLDSLFISQRATRIFSRQTDSVFYETVDDIWWVSSLQLKPLCPKKHSTSLIYDDPSFVVYIDVLSARRSIKIYTCINIYIYKHNTHIFVYLNALCINMHTRFMYVIYGIAPYNQQTPCKMYVIQANIHVVT